GCAWSPPAPALSDPAPPSTRTAPSFSRTAPSFSRTAPSFSRTAPLCRGSPPLLSATIAHLLDPFIPSAIPAPIPPKRERVVGVAEVSAPPARVAGSVAGRARPLGSGRVASQNFPAPGDLRQRRDRRRSADGLRARQRRHPVGPRASRDPR